jgi:hypothetical protein
VAPEAISNADLIDEFGELDRQVQQFKPQAERHEFLKKLIRSWFDDEPAAQTAIATGNVYEIQLTAKLKERTWTDIFKLYRALGREKFLSVCEVALGKAEELLGKPKVATLVSEALTGSRRLKPVLRTPAA